MMTIQGEVHSWAMICGDQYVPRMAGRIKGVTVWEVSINHRTALQNGKPHKKISLELPMASKKRMKGTAPGKRCDRQN
jgi:hypothetical protein